MYAQEKRGSLVSEVMHVQTWATKTTSILKSNKLPELTEKNEGAITVNSSIHAFLDHSGWQQTYLTTDFQYAMDQFSQKYMYHSNSNKTC